MMRPNPAKVMKATVPKDALMKGTHLNRPCGFQLFDILASEKKHMQLLQKLLGIKYDRKKKQKILYFLLGSKFIWSMLHPEINKNY